MSLRISLSLISKTLCENRSSRKTIILLTEDHPLLILIKNTFTICEYEYKSHFYEDRTIKTTLEESYLKSKEFKMLKSTISTTINIEELFKQNTIDTINNDLENSKRIFEVVKYSCIHCNVLINSFYYVYFNKKLDKLEYYLNVFTIYEKYLIETMMINKGLTDESIGKLLYKKDRFKHIKPVS